MRDHLSKSAGNFRKDSRNLRENMCWQFNWGKCNDCNCKKGEHRCSYCGTWGHGMHNCRKKQKGDKGVSHGGEGSEDKDVTKIN